MNLPITFDTNVDDTLGDIRVERVTDFVQTCSGRIMDNVSIYSDGKKMQRSYYFQISKILN